MAAMSSKPVKPTKLELSVLRVLWKNGPGTVREVHAEVNAAKPTALNTVLKILQIMTEKQLVTRDDSARPQVYRARYSQERTQAHLVKDLVERAFEGSVRALVMRALSTRKPSPKILEAMEKLLDEFEGEGK
jgi:predicted transcriptional regulator